MYKLFLVALVTGCLPDEPRSPSPAADTGGQPDDGVDTDTNVEPDTDPDTQRPTPEPEPEPFFDGFPEGPISAEEAPYWTYQCMRSTAEYPILWAGSEPSFHTFIGTTTVLDNRPLYGCPGSAFLTLEDEYGEIVQLVGVRHNAAPSLNALLEPGSRVRGTVMERREFAFARIPLAASAIVFDDYGAVMASHNGPLNQVPWPTGADFGSVPIAAVVASEETRSACNEDVTILNLTFRGQLFSEGHSDEVEGPNPPVRFTNVRSQIRWGSDCCTDCTLHRITHGLYPNRSRRP